MGRGCRREGRREVFIRGIVSSVKNILESILEKHTEDFGKSVEIRFTIKFQNTYNKIL